MLCSWSGFLFTPHEDCALHIAFCSLAYLCVVENSFILAFSLYWNEGNSWEQPFSLVNMLWPFKYYPSFRWHFITGSLRARHLSAQCPGMSWSASITCKIALATDAMGNEKHLQVPRSKTLKIKEIYIQIICGNSYSVLLASKCLLAKIWKPAINQVALGKITTSLRILLLAAKSRCFSR